MSTASDRILTKMERLAGIAERFQGLAVTLPRFVEMLGVSMLAGRASERVGGQFMDGAIAGAVADGLAHSNLPNNPIGGIALGAYFAGLGLLTVAPVSGDFLGALPDPPRLTTVLTREECAEQGGVWIEGILGGGCRLPG